MKKFRKKFSKRLGRFGSFALALVLVALPLMSFPVMAAEPLETTVTYADADTSVEYRINNHYGHLGYYYFVSPFIPTAVVSWVNSYGSVVENPTLNSATVPGFDIEIPGSYLGDSSSDSSPNIYIVNESFVQNNGTEVPAGIYFFRGQDKLSITFTYVPAPSFVGSVGDGIVGVLGWIGAVIGALLTSGGAMSALLPLFAVSVAISGILLAIKIIRGFTWGS